MSGLANLVKTSDTYTATLRVAQPSDNEENYVSQHRPDENLRRCIRGILGTKFDPLARSLIEDGIVIIPAYYNSELLNPLRAYLDDRFAEKPIDPFLRQVSFNAAVDKTDATCPQAIADIAQDSLLICLASDALGHVVRIANWRAYRLEPTRPQLYRAWDWHTDQKRGELKAMILLTDVTSSDQAMHYIKGSHRHWWRLSTQKDSKFTFDEAVSLGTLETITECIGPAGTLILFNTNGIHRGTRTQGASRDIVSINYVPNLPNSPVFSFLWPDTGEPSGPADRIRQHLRGGTYKPDIDSLPLISEDLVSSVLARLDAMVWNRYVNDAGPERLHEMRKCYQRTPRTEDLKLRYNGTDLGGFLAENYQSDLRTDLDLPIRLGSGDVERDVELVRLRDSLDGDVHLHFKDSCRHLDPRLEKAPQSINEYKEIWFSLLRRIAMSKTGAPDRKHALAVFAEDLVSAMDRVDTMQRLRSNALYLSLVSMTLDIANGDTEFGVVLSSETSSLIAAYASIVLEDDLAATGVVR
jgi:hypothetical protein